MQVGIATDHGGFGLKEELVSQFRAAGHEVIDFGAHNLDQGDDYPDFVHPARSSRCSGKRATRSCHLRQRRGRVGVRQQDSGHFSARQGVEDDNMFDPFFFSRHPR
jgi:ribose 5-phosphate isomerase B